VTGSGFSRRRRRRRERISVSGRRTLVEGGGKIGAVDPNWV